MSRKARITITCDVDVAELNLLSSKDFIAEITKLRESMTCGDVSDLIEDEAFTWNIEPILGREPGIQALMDEQKAEGQPFCTRCQPSQPCPLHSGGEYR